MDRRVSRAVPAQIESIIRLDESVLGSRIRERMIREAVTQGQCYIIKTESGVAVLGILNYHFYENGFIELFIVGKEYRRRGLGRALVESFKELCQTDKLFTSTNSSNIPMQKLLGKCGFKRCGWIDQLDEGDPELVYCFERKKQSGKPVDAGTIDQQVESLRIIPLSREHVNDLGDIQPDQTFTVFGRVVPAYNNGVWTWTEELFDQPYEKQYPDETINYSEYIDHPDQTILLAYLNNQYVGWIRMRRSWNKYCFIDEIAVSRDYRRQGAGRALVEAAAAWAEKGGMPGLMLETQDNNLAACRFYQRLGFRLGGLDIMLYRNTPYKNEKALFWFDILSGLKSRDSQKKLPNSPHKHLSR